MSDIGLSLPSRRLSRSSEGATGLRGIERLINASDVLDFDVRCPGAPLVADAPSPPDASHPWLVEGLAQDNLQFKRRLRVSSWDYLVPC